MWQVMLALTLVSLFMHVCGWYTFHFLSMLFCPFLTALCMQRAVNVNSLLAPKAILLFPWSYRLGVVASKQSYGDRFLMEASGVLWLGEETQHRIATYKYLRGSRSRGYIKKCFLQMKVVRQRTGLPCKIVSSPILEIFVLERTLLQLAAPG